MLFRFFLSHQCPYEGVPLRFYGVAGNRRIFCLFRSVFRFHGLTCYHCFFTVRRNGYAIFLRGNHINLCVALTDCCSLGSCFFRFRLNAGRTAEDNQNGKKEHGHLFDHGILLLEGYYSVTISTSTFPNASNNSIQTTAFG